jgi:hypothetical protein
MAKFINSHNKRLKRTNIRCHLFCKETQKSRHQTFARLAGRYVSVKGCNMNQLLIFLFFFYVSFPISAQQSENGYSYESKALPSHRDDLNTIETIRSQFELGNKYKFKIMINKLCSNLMAARTDESLKIGNKLETIMLHYNGLTQETSDYKEKLEHFWDVNKNDFICEANSHYGKQHILKVMVDMQLYRPILIKYFLSKKTGYKLNMNAFEVVNGKPETIVDYLQEIMEGKNSSENYDTRSLRRLLVILKRKFNGKSGEQLLVENPMLLKQDVVNKN